MLPDSWSNRRLYLAFSCALLIVCAVGIAHYVNATALAENVRWVLNAHEVQQKLETMLWLLRYGDIGPRAEAPSTEQAYSEMYTRNRLRLSAQLADVRRLTADNPAQQRRLESLDALVNKRIDLISKAIEAWKTAGLRSAVEVTTTGGGPALMREIRKLIGEMQTEEDSLLVRRTSEQQVKARKTITIVI